MKKAREANDQMIIDMTMVKGKNIRGVTLIHFNQEIYNTDKNLMIISHER